MVRIEHTVPRERTRWVAEALVTATGLPWEEILETLPGYLEAELDMTLLELVTSGAEQERFMAFVMSERQRKTTADVEALAVVSTQGF